MRKVLSIFILQLFTLPLFAQDVKNGYIIDKDTYVFGYTYGQNNNSFRFTPSVADIEKAEAIVMDNKSYIRDQPNAFAGKDIFKHYNRYFKQYVGFLNKDGERLILINYIHKSHMRHITSDSYKNEIISVLDGGNHYWRTEVNIDKEILISVDINGEA